MFFKKNFVNTVTSGNIVNFSVRWMRQENLVGTADMDWPRQQPVPCENAGLEFVTLPIFQMSLQIGILTLHLRLVECWFKIV